MHLELRFERGETSDPPYMLGKTISDIRGQPRRRMIDYSQNRRPSDGRGDLKVTDRNMMGREKTKSKE